SEVIVAVTLVPVEAAAGFMFDSVQFVPAGAPTITQPSATLPVKPFRPLTRSVSVMLVPTFVATMGVLAVTVKSFTDSVTFVERTRLFSVALVPVMAMVALAAGVVPKVVCIVTVEVSPVTPGVMVGGFAEQVVLPTSNAGSVHPTAMSCVMPPRGVKVMV